MQENIGVFTEHSVDKETTKNRRHSRRDNVSTNDAYTCISVRYNHVVSNNNTVAGRRSDAVFHGVIDRDTQRGFHGQRTISLTSGLVL